MRYVAAAFATDLALGLSLGLFYTITYYGRALVPLPGFVALGAPFMYYVAVEESYSTVVQAWLWMFVFAVAGLLWRLALTYVPQVVRDRKIAQSSPKRLGDISSALRYTNWPLLLPMPLLVWLVGTPSGQWEWADFIGVCLRRQNVDSPMWLTPLMMALALLAVVLEIRAIWRLLPPENWRRRAEALPICLWLFIMTVFLVGFALNAALHYLTA